MGFRRGFEIVSGLIAIAGGLFRKEFKPIGRTTWLIWGRDENALYSKMGRRVILLCARTLPALYRHHG